jgi:hypothetical protein
MAKSTTFGKYIDTWIRLTQPGSKLKLTDYIKDYVAEKSDLSDRQIQRMRDLREGELPEAKSMLKLVEAFTDLQALSPVDICDRLLLPWSVVEKRQAELAGSDPSKVIQNTITIVSGWQEPKALSGETIITTMTDNLERGFNYKFVYPHKNNYPQKTDKVIDPETMVDEWLKRLRRKIDGKWYNRAMDMMEEVDTIDQKLPDYRANLLKKVQSVSTYENSDFWFLLPSNYVVLYNIEPEYSDRKSTDRYGVMQVSGIQLPVCSDDVDSDLHTIYANGWLYIDQNTYNGLANAYTKSIVLPA